jgi:hypothetical protein
MVSAMWEMIPSHDSALTGWSMTHLLCSRFLLDAPESYRPGLWEGKFVMVTSPKPERYKVSDGKEKA